MGEILDGKMMSEGIFEKLSEIVKSMDLSTKSIYKQFVIVTTGSDDASKVYVRSKAIACDRLNIACLENHYDYFDHDACQDLIQYLSKCGYPPFIIQLPMTGDYTRNQIYNDLKAHLVVTGVEDPDGLIHRMDVDGIISPDNILMTYAPNYVIGPDLHNLIDDHCLPCTPWGIMNLIDSVFSDYLKGSVVTIIGRSDLVAKPLQMMLMDRDATVLMAHTNTPTNLIQYYIGKSDIVITATGSTKLLTKDFFKLIDVKNKLLIDVGMNRDENGKLRGDCDPEIAKDFKWYTPVPGGVGPMTVASLMVNVVKYYQKPNCANYAGAILPMYPAKIPFKMYNKKFYKYSDK